MARGELPCSVATTITGALRFSEASTALIQTASVMVVADLPIDLRSIRAPTSRSVRWQIVAIVVTASRGYLPLADSPESITASEPSKIALATSPASARVGRGFLIIESSICVAVITVFPASLQR